MGVAVPLRFTQTLKPRNVRRRLKAAFGVVALSLFLFRDAAATTIFVYVSPEGDVIAADSLSNRMEGGQRHVCKIAQVSDHMLFIASGTGATENPKFDPYEIARIDSINARNPREAAD